MRRPNVSILISSMKGLRNTNGTCTSSCIVVEVDAIAPRTLLDCSGERGFGEVFGVIDNKIYENEWK